MSNEPRATARDIAQEHLLAGDPLGWFESLYSRSAGDTSIIPWADLKANPNLVSWLDINNSTDLGLALKVGCGLGDDAEELAKRGYSTTAFDISESAIGQCRKRFPDSSVEYVVADLFSAPAEWKARFDLVIESYTLQVLPPDLRIEAMKCISSFISPGGILLVIARGREENESKGKMPWPLTKKELSFFEDRGLQEMAFEDYIENEDPPVRRFRATYRKAVK
ncbi:MAG: class I SAM-dependent methyltransferase [Desulfobacterales bacterium]|nr:class I SAM-dependent methyltransferase [Desulfobacterales bacterium]